MELTVRGKNLEITDALHTYVEKHTGKIQRYFDKPIKINVLLRISNMTKTCEVTVFVDGVILRGVEKSDDMYKSIDLVFDKVERQIHKYKTRLAKKFKERNTLSKQFMQEEEAVQPVSESAFEIVKTKYFNITPMSPEEAILQMNLLGHSFFMFFNSETEGMAVVYRRDDGKYGLIDANK
jgi:putative sigma-54 modulation protein